MGIKFKVSHHPEAEPAHRYRYTICHGKNKATSEGYPTHQHVDRAVNGIWNGLAKAFGYGAIGKATIAAVGGAKAPPVPYTADSLKPPATGRPAGR